MSEIESTCRDRVQSPWSIGVRCRMLLWQLCWALFCGWTPKPLNRWRLLWFRMFGGGCEGRPFIHQRCRLEIPWRIQLGDRSCVGDRAHLYSLGMITLGRGSIVAQEAYLCTGDHDRNKPGKPLVTAAIHVGEDAFVGMRALILPGVTIHARAVVGAGAVVTRDVGVAEVVAGNPARPLND